MQSPYVLAELVRQRQEEFRVEAARRRLASIAGDRPWWRRTRSTSTEARHSAGRLVPCAPAVVE
jgi:hypothetical protein